MIQKIINSIIPVQERSEISRRYQPERPLGFVRRTDPSFYFLSKR